MTPNQFHGFVAGGLAYFTEETPSASVEATTTKLSRILPWLSHVIRTDPQWPAQAVAALQRKHLLLTDLWEGRQADSSYDLTAVQKCVLHVTAHSGDATAHGPGTSRGITPSAAKAMLNVDANHYFDNDATDTARLAAALSDYVQHQRNVLLAKEGNDCSNLFAAMLSESCPVLTLVDLFEKQVMWNAEQYAFVVDFDADLVSFFTRYSSESGTPPPTASISDWEPLSCASLRCPAEMDNMAEELAANVAIRREYPRGWPTFTGTSSLQDTWAQSLQRWQRWSGAAQRSLRQSTCAVNSNRPPGFPLLTTFDGELFKSDVDLSLLPDDYYPSSRGTPPSCPTASSTTSDGERCSRLESETAGDALGIDEQAGIPVGNTHQPVDDNLKQRIRDRKLASKRRLSNAELANEFGVSETQVQRITAGLPPKQRDRGKRR